MFREQLKVPKERLSVIIGTKGQIKKRLQLRTKTKILINSKEGDIIIEGTDSFMVYKVKKVLQAIARGFNPDITFLLLDDDYMLEIINLKDFFKSKNKIIRTKSRVIGTKGKCRKTIEELTHCHISIYGKTISLIGKLEDIDLGRRAIEKLILGSKHANVYRFIEKFKESHSL